MGSSRWNDLDYTDAVNSRVRSAGTPFVHDKAVRDGTAPAKTHNLLDPKGLKVRESRDSKEHPESNAIVVALDVTGSMGSVVRTIHSKLPTLMGLLIRKSYLPDPQILFAAVGDANSDSYPLQVGQFESGVEMDGDLSRIIIEGSGGGQDMESYDLMAYIGARKTSMDCLEKRGKKGYFFFIGDERTYPEVLRKHITNLIGDTLEAEIPTKKIFEELKEKFNVFYILPKGASHGGSSYMISHWKELIGPENVLELADAAAAAELIASQIGLCEGADVDTITKDLTDVGTSEALVKVVSNSVSRAYGGAAVTRVSAGTLIPSSDPGNIKRL